MRICWRCCEHYSLLAWLWQWTLKDLASVDTERAWDGDIYFWLARNQVLFCLLSPIIRVSVTWRMIRCPLLLSPRAGEQTTVAVWAEREREPVTANRQLWAATARYSGRTIRLRQKIIQRQGNWWISASSAWRALLCTWDGSEVIESHQWAIQSHQRQCFTVTAIYENNFMLSATSLLIGRPGVIVLHFLWFIILHKSLCILSPALLSLLLCLHRQHSPLRQAPTWTRRCQRVMDGQNYVRMTFCCSRFIYHQEKTGWISFEVHCGEDNCCKRAVEQKLSIQAQGSEEGREGRGPVSMGTQGSHAPSAALCQHPRAEIIEE